MFENGTYKIKATAALLIAGSLFCVFFGQGTHIHDLDLHIGDYFDVHFHVHAHESHDEPLETDQNQEKNKHQHKVSTASDIIGTLTTPLQVKPDVKKQVVGTLYAGFNLVNRKFDEPPTLFDLPPPRPVANQYLLSSFTHRGPPIT